MNQVVVCGSARAHPAATTVINNLQRRQRIRNNLKVKHCPEKSPTISHCRFVVCRSSYFSTTHKISGRQNWIGIGFRWRRTWMDRSNAKGVSVHWRSLPIRTWKDGYNVIKLSDKRKWRSWESAMSSRQDERETCRCWIEEEEKTERKRKKERKPLVAAAGLIVQEQVKRVGNQRPTEM